MKRPTVDATPPYADGGRTPEAIPHSAFRTPHLLTAAFIIMAGNLLSRLLGLAREQLASYYFGTGDRIAPFRVADSLLTIL